MQSLRCVLQVAARCCLQRHMSSLNRTPFILQAQNRGSFSKRIASSAAPSNQFGDNSGLVVLANKVNEALSSSSGSNDIMKRFNLSQEVVDLFKCLSGASLNDKESHEILTKLKSLLDENTFGILEEVFSGSVDGQLPSTGVKCCGCGALLQSHDRLKPGFISGEQMALRKQSLDDIRCKRCCAIQVYDVALETTIKPKLFKRMVANQIRSNRNSVVLVMVDLTNFTCTTLPNLLTGILHKRSEILLIGNKFDLIPPDAMDFEKRIKEMLRNSTDMLQTKVKDVHLISAKTGHGVEKLITAVQRLWQSKHDVYLIGEVNVGKSSLFNMLLESDIGKGQMIEYFQKATVSKWPGTTLNTLKFPLERVTLGKLKFRGACGVHDPARKTGSSDAYAIGKVKRLFSKGMVQFRDDDHFRSPFEISFQNKKTPYTSRDQTWFYDTPGILNDDSILPLLNHSELQKVIPSKPYTPRIFYLSPRQTLSYGGLGRIEFTKGTDDIILFIFSSSLIPVVVAGSVETEEHFQEWLNAGRLQIPSTVERYNQLGPFYSTDINLRSDRHFHVFYDIMFAATGWVTVMLKNEGKTANLKASCLHSAPALRTPLLNRVNRMMGKHEPGTPRYRLRKDFNRLFLFGKNIYKKTRKPLNVHDMT